MNAQERDLLDRLHAATGGWAIVEAEYLTAIVTLAHKGLVTFMSAPQRRFSGQNRNIWTKHDENVKVQKYAVYLTAEGATAARNI